MSVLSKSQFYGFINSTKAIPIWVFVFNSKLSALNKVSKIFNFSCVLNKEKIKNLAEC